jgi:adenylate cyclase class 2
MRRMGNSTQEIEVKLPFESAAEARSTVERLGATVDVPRTFEDNLVFDHEALGLRAGDKLLRLRLTGDVALLTVKLPVAGEFRHKVREEHETRVEDFEATRRLFQGLGFTTTYRYQKYRTTYRLGGLHICLDETPLGCFVELEGPADEIDRTAESMGYGEDRYISESYGELHRRTAEAQGVPRGDLMFETGDPGA